MDGSQRNDNSTVTYGIPVSSLQRSTCFYRDDIGLDVVTDTGIAGTARLIPPHGPQFLLAGPDAPPWAELLEDGYTVLRKSDTIFIGDPAFEHRLERLQGDATVPLQLIERPWGDRIIEITDPDGYTIAIWMIRERTREEILTQFRMGRDGLRTSIAGMTEAALHTRPDAGSWTVAEIVHHLADSDLTVLHAVRVALAEPGKHYHGNAYDQDLYATELRYQQRDIDPSLRFFEATRDQILAMIEVIPAPWERSITTRSGKTTVETYLLMAATHALEHIEQIRGIRRQIDYA